jgi:DNA-binding transcriptional MerR regulator
VRISELSAATGVSVPTIKYYLREGLLPRGTPTGPNQAAYDEAHVRRLRLIRALIDVGGLGIAVVRRVLAAIDDRSLSTHQLLGVAHHALGPDVPDGPVPEDLARALRDVDRFIDELGWRVGPDAPARGALAEALVTLRRLGRPVDPDVFVPYARLVDELAAMELDTVAHDAPVAEAVEQSVVGTVVYEAALVAMRRLALEHRAAARFEPQDPAGPRTRTGRRSARAL